MTESANNPSDSVQRNVERERKFSVEPGWEPGPRADSAIITQAYEFAADGYALRIRRVHRDRGHDVLVDVRSTVTVKGPPVSAATRR